MAAASTAAASSSVKAAQARGYGKVSGDGSVGGDQDDEADDDDDDGANSPSSSTSGSSSGSSEACDRARRLAAGRVPEGVLTAFLAMEARRLRRVQQGRIVRKGLAPRVVSAVELLILFGLLVQVVSLNELLETWRECTWIPVAVTLALVVPTLVQTIAVPENTLLEWLTTEVYVWCLWAAWEFRPLRPFVDECSGLMLGRFCAAEEELVLFCTFVVVLTVTCLLYLPHRFIMPWVIAHGGWGARLALFLRDIRPEEEAKRFSYRPSGWLLFARAEFAYRGSVDSRGRPHGEGVWFDDSFHGECLRGTWVRGCPAGAFTSREHGTGALFQQRPIGYATSRADCPPQSLGSSSCVPRKGEALRCGIGQVEVSFAGGFFPFLPSVEHHSAEASVVDMAVSLLRAHRWMDREARPHIPLEVIGEEEARERSRLAREDDSTARRVLLPVQFVEGDGVGSVCGTELAALAACLARPTPEALVFIHGYNCDIATAMGRVAQTLALGSMQAHIVPFVFSYSGGGPLSYFGAKSRMGEYGGDLARFLRELAEQFQEVHILTHSCGADFLVKNWPSIAPCFMPSSRSRVPASRLRQPRAPARWVPKCPRPPGRCAGELGVLHLATLTMMNPDVLLEDVFRLMPSIMDVAEHFTAYNDRNDQALFYSTWLQRCVPRWYQRREQPPGVRTLVLGTSLQSWWITRHDGCRAELDGPLVDLAFGRKKELRRNYSAEFVPGTQPHAPGDGSVEIIDCSNIDQNVHSLRHNYYMLNTQMVEDVCELVGKRLTAPHRSRLARVHANVFSFIAPPRYVKEQ